MNLNGLSLDQGIVVRADSTSAPLPLSYADGIATDVPYGRASSTKGKATAAIITQFTRAAADLLDYAESRKKPKYCVVMHPLGIDFDYDASLFELAEEHHLYVHRNLTRSISVLKRRKGT